MDGKKYPLYGGFSNEVNMSIKSNGQINSIIILIVLLMTGIAFAGPVAIFQSPMNTIARFNAGEGTEWVVADQLTMEDVMPFLLSIHKKNKIAGTFGLKNNPGLCNVYYTFGVDHQSAVAEFIQLDDKHWVYYSPIADKVLPLWRLIK
jgi:hypothetical protein